MHIAFDGGCFQQGILGGIYQVACGFLNAAKADHPDLRVTLVCDPRQGIVRPAALDGLTWQPEIVYAPVARSYDDPEPWPTTTDPNVRFFVDGGIVPAVLENGVARYAGPAPKRAFAILSRAGSLAVAGPKGDQCRRGIRVERIVLSGNEQTLRIAGHDRRLSAGFLDSDEGARWTDGAGFIPLACFPKDAESVTAEVTYSAQERYAMKPGLGAEAVLKARRARRDRERDLALEALAERLRAAGCQAYVANHFTPINVPGLTNAAWAYDLIPVLLPQYFHADAQVNFRENLKVFAKADRVYAISDCTRNDLIAQTPVPPARVITAGIAPSAIFSPRDPSAVRPVLSPFGLRPGGYILAVGTIEPRKNHMRLLQAYRELRNRLPDCPDLVLVGKMGWDFQQILSFREESGIGDSIKILSDLSDDDLACLYSGALFSAYLSVYEGFGLPIVEAMACGCPVLTSDRSSMPEVAGKAALLVNPYSVDAIVAALHELATSDSLRSNLAEQGKIRARAFTWSQSSRVVMDDLAQLIAAA